MRTCRDGAEFEGTEQHLSSRYFKAFYSLTSEQLCLIGIFSIHNLSIFLADCFMCSLCPKRLDGEVFYFSSETKQPLCKEDYERQVISVAQCKIEYTYQKYLVIPQLDYIIFYSFEFRYEAKTCNTCSGKIIEEKFISTNTDKYYHQDCYNIN